MVLLQIHMQIKEGSLWMIAVAYLAQERGAQASLHVVSSVEEDIRPLRWYSKATHDSSLIVSTIIWFLSHSDSGYLRRIAAMRAAVPS